MPISSSACAHEAVAAEHHDPRVGADEGRRHQRQHRERGEEVAARDHVARGQRGERNAEQHRAQHSADADDQAVDERRLEERLAEDLRVVAERRRARRVVDEARREDRESGQTSSTATTRTQASMTTGPEIGPQRARSSPAARCGRSSPESNACRRASGRIERIARRPRSSWSRSGR